VPAVKGKEASDSGQFGLALRFPVDAIDTEIGLYAMNIHSRLPVSGSRTGTNWKDLTPTQQAILQAAGLIGTDSYGNWWGSSARKLRGLMPGVENAAETVLALNGQPGVDLKSGVGFWEYPEDIQIYGISAATNVAGWSTSAEVSYQVDVPVMINGNDLIGAGVLGIGPYRAAARAAQAQSEGTYLAGSDRFDKTQAQLNFVKTFSNVIGAENMVVVGEIGGQWNNVPDYTKGGLRYGRGFMFGTGSSFEGYGPSPDNPTGLTGSDIATQGDFCSPTYVGVPVPTGNALYNPHPIGCKNDGYITDMAWGYRVRVTMDYNNALNTGVTVSPSVFWADDVEGVSMDPTFNEDRQTLGLGLKFSLNKKYVVDLNYVQYTDKNFDPLFDRDYYSAAMSVTF
jgi:hypothetical protein